MSLCDGRFDLGYSCLGYLAKLLLEMLKIDRSFIVSMLDDPSIMTPVSTVISLAHSLKLTVVAEVPWRGSVRFCWRCQTEVSI